MPSLEARLQRLEHGAHDNALCTDPRCLRLELLRCLRRAKGLPEYPLPAHPKNPPRGSTGGLAAVLASLNRGPDESEEAHAEHTKPKPYVDPYFGPAAAMET